MFKKIKKNVQKIKRNIKKHKNVARIKNVFKKR